MEEVEVPSYFLCPISLQIMRDPVTLSTGITYDRDNIERWIFSGNRHLCPVTNQSLPDLNLTPNHTLRRLIQLWCTANTSNGVERIPTPRSPIDRASIVKLLDEAKLPQSQLSSLLELKSIISESSRNRLCVAQTSGAIDLLVSLIKSNIPTTSPCDEALSILCSLQLSEEGILDLATKNVEFIDTLTSIMARSNRKSRTHAMILLNSIVSVIAPTRLVGLREELFYEIVRVLRDKVSRQATKAALEALNGICPWGRNRIKVVESGAVAALVELLLDEPDRRVIEMVLVVLDKLCGRAEGRAEIVAHDAGIAVVSKKILRVSTAASQRAVRILYSVSKYSGTASVLQEMLVTGVVSKLCLVVQVDCGVKTKEKAIEILRLHSKVWMNSPCLSSQLKALYPSSKQE